MFNRLKVKRLVEEYQNKNKGKTLQNVADGIGISNQTLYDITNRESFPKVNIMEKIAEFFHVDMNYFFDQYESKPLPTHTTCEPEAHYGKENPWKVCFDLQREITELKVEVERCKKFTNAQDVGTKTA